jgi:epoxyqueuosine reductase QueG
VKPPVNIDFIRREVADWVAAYSTRKGVTDWWRTPLLVSATIDERFKVLPEIAAPDHLLPNDLLETVRTVIVFFLPFKRALVAENSQGKFPVRNWLLAYNDTNILIEHVNDNLSQTLATTGFRSATTPPTANFDKDSLMSRWSHKHLGHLAGLGRFGVNAQLSPPRAAPAAWAAWSPWRPWAIIP